MICRACTQDKPEGDFYVSNKSRCKECVKARVRANRASKLECYRDYDRHRSMQPHRVAARYQYQQTEQGREAANRAKRAWTARNPKKRDAANQVSNAVRDGKLIKPEACEECRQPNSRIEGHHDDYDKPLDVRWLCPACHSAWHKENGEAANAA